MALIFRSFVLYIFLTLFGLGIYLIIFFWKSYSYWKKKGVVFIKPTLPFGNMKNVITFRKSTAEVHQTLYNELEGHRFGGFYMITKPRLLIRDPDLIKSILVRDFAHFYDKGFTVDERRAPLTANLPGLSGKRWKNLRTKLTPMFTSGKIKMMFPIFVDCANEMIIQLKENLQSKKIIDIKEIVSQFTTDVIGSCAFGLQLNSIKEPNSEFRRVGRKFSNPSFLLSLVFLFRSSFPIVTSLLAPFLGDFSTFFLKAVDDVVKYREKTGIKRNDFLQLLIQLKNKEKLDADTVEEEESYMLSDTENMVLKGNEIELTDSLLAAQCFMFFTAGFETSSTTVSFCLYELALNPDIQNKLRDEIDLILKEHQGKITYNSIMQIKYLDQVIDETLRKYPPGAVLTRKCTIPYKVSGTDITIEKGVQVIIPVYALHHDPKYYPDPKTFDPERFSDENKASRIPFTYLPFGEGPRICLGMRFGLLQTKVGIAALISNFKFSVCENTIIPIQFNPKSFVVLGAKDGIWLKIEPR